MTTITQSISSLGSVPTTADPATFDSRADTFLGTSLPTLRTEINTWAGQANTVAGEVNTNATTATTQAGIATTQASASAASASASAASAVTSAAVGAGLGNFIGLWSAQTGAKTVPTSVSHNGILYYLLSNIADITAKTPGVASEWAAIERLLREARTSNTMLDVADHGKFIDVTTSGFSQTFQAAATLGASWFVYIRNGGTGLLTLDPNASETIEGATTLVMNPGETACVQCNGSAFFAAIESRNAGEHIIELHTGNGHGSTNTCIRRFTTAMTNTGTAMTYADSAANGMSVTINHAGLYSITYSDQSNSTANIGITVNSAALTTPVRSVPVATRKAHTYAVSGCTGQCNCVIKLEVGNVVRAHTDGLPGTPATTDVVQFAIRKIGNY